MGLSPSAFSKDMSTDKITVDSPFMEVVNKVEYIDQIINRLANGRCQFKYTRLIVDRKVNYYTEFHVHNWDGADISGLIVYTVDNDGFYVRDIEILNYESDLSEENRRKYTEFLERLKEAIVIYFAEKVNTSFKIDIVK